MCRIMIITGATGGKAWRHADGLATYERRESDSTRIILFVGVSSNRSRLYERKRILRAF